MLIITTGLVILLLSLALLQYRWLSQVSAAEYTRMQSMLKTSASRFSDDFDRELTRAYLHFQLPRPPLEPQEDLKDTYLRLYQDWLKTAPYPKLIGDIHISEKTGEDLKVYCLKDTFEQCTPPEHIRRALEGIKPQGEQREVAMVIRDPVNSDIPALIVRSLNMKRTRTGLETVAVLTESCAVLSLDTAYLEREFIPQLLAKSFPKGVYSYAVYSKQNPSRFFYRSDKNFSSDEIATVDIKTDLFKIRHNEFQNFVLNTVVARSTQPQPKVIVGGAKQLSFTFRTEKVRVVEDKTATIFYHENSNNGWVLGVKHPEGSLLAAVDSLRRRNLMISFGVLLLLGISILMLVISTRRAQELARQQMEFVSAVSHELRTPLTVIRSAGENLADGLIRSSEQVARYGKLIEGEGRRLSEMVEQILEFAGAQSKQRSYDMRPVDMATVVDSVIESCKPLLEEKGFQLERNISESLPIVLGDHHALMRAVNNLLTNAIKYSAEQRWIGISLHPNDKGIELTVEDCGIGIHPEDLPYIFEPFYRCKQVVDEQIHGSGLGLSLVKQIVEAHSGSISVESELGRKSRFTLFLPAATLPVNRSLETRYEQAHSSS